MEVRAVIYGDMRARLCALHRSIKETPRRVDIVSESLQPKGEEIITHVNLYVQPEREDETYKFLSIDNYICQSNPKGRKS